MASQRAQICSHYVLRRVSLCLFTLVVRTTQGSAGGVVRTNIVFGDAAPSSLPMPRCIDDF